MTDLKACFSSKTDDWATPQDFYDKLDDEFHFTLGPCADEYNHKCDLFYTKEQNGLAQDWGGHVVFCNPPYGKEIESWVRYAYEQSRKPGTTVVMLIPARTDTRYFHDYIYGKAELRFVRGRLKFGDATSSAPFPSMVVVYRCHKDVLGETANNEAADVEPLVRCMECKHHYWEQEPCYGKTVHYCKLPHMSGVEVFKEFFCYYGERKEGAD